MLFNSYVYLLLFLPISLVVFAAVARLSLKAGFAWLAMASLGFYAWWNPAPGQPWNPFYVALLLASCAGNYLAGKAIARHRKSAAGRRLLVLAVTANLLLLGYYKYTGFLLDLSRSLTGLPGQIPQIILPLAISFFTFLQIAYLVDASKGMADDHGFLDYLIFVTFFPHLIAGPLVHHREMIPQFTRRGGDVLRSRDLSVGFTLLVIGLFKKIVLADPLAREVSPLFDAATLHGGLSTPEAWAATIGYTLQLYFDFSGYSDMAIGSARLFGIRFPLNFHSPYKANSIVEFWRRWHITLSRFLRDYLYIALGGNRRGTVRRYSNLLLTMILGGLWHGAGWTFLIWGGIHGLLLCVNHAWAKIRSARDWRSLPAPIAIGLTFLAVAFAWIFFRAHDIGTATSIFLATVGVTNSGSSGTDLGAVWPMIAIGLSIVWFAPNSQEFLGRYRPALGAGDKMAANGPKLWWQWRPTLPFALITFTLLYAAARRFEELSEFIYFQF